MFISLISGGQGKRDASCCEGRRRAIGIRCDRSGFSPLRQCDRVRVWWEKSKKLGGRVLRVGGLGWSAGVGLEYAKEEVRSDWKTAQHRTFLIANRDGPSRRLNGRLFHECAWDRHVDGSGGDSRNFSDSKQLTVTTSTNRKKKRKKSLFS